MTRNGTDLGLLSRSHAPPRGDGAGERAFVATAGAGSAVPRPKSRWKTRVALPAALLLVTAGLLAYAARDALRPATPVRVVPVVVRTVQDAGPAAGPGGGGASTAGGGATVQAPGWVEPDPFPPAGPALADGGAREALGL